MGFWKGFSTGVSTTMPEAIRSFNQSVSRAEGRASANRMSLYNDAKASGDVLLAEKVIGDMVKDGSITAETGERMNLTVQKNYLTRLDLQRHTDIEQDPGSDYAPYITEQAKKEFSPTLKNMRAAELSVEHEEQEKLLDQEQRDRDTHERNMSRIQFTSNERKKAASILALEREETAKKELELRRKRNAQLLKGEQLAKYDKTIDIIQALDGPKKFFKLEGSYFKLRSVLEPIFNTDSTELKNKGSIHITALNFFQRMIDDAVVRSDDVALQTQAETWKEGLQRRLDNFIATGGNFALVGENIVKQWLEDAQNLYEASALVARSQIEQELAPRRTINKETGENIFGYSKETLGALDSYMDSFVPEHRLREVAEKNTPKIRIGTNASRARVLRNFEEGDKGGPTPTQKVLGDDVENLKAILAATYPEWSDERVNQYVVDQIKKTLPPDQGESTTEKISKYLWPSDGADKTVDDESGDDLKMDPEATAPPVPPSDDFVPDTKYRTTFSPLGPKPVFEDPGFPQQEPGETPQELSRRQREFIRGKTKLGVRSVAETIYNTAKGMVGETGSDRSRGIYIQTWRQNRWNAAGGKGKVPGAWVPGDEKRLGISNSSSKLDSMQVVIDSSNLTPNQTTDFLEQVLDPNNKNLSVAEIFEDMNAEVTYMGD